MTFLWLKLLLGALTFTSLLTEMYVTVPSLVPEETELDQGHRFCT